MVCLGFGDWVWIGLIQGWKYVLDLVGSEGGLHCVRVWEGLFWVSGEGGLGLFDELVEFRSGQRGAGGGRGY